MDNETLKWLIENGAVAVPFVLAMWGRLEMIARKIGKNTRDITTIRFELTGVKEEQDRQKDDMFCRIGQLNNQR